MKLIRLTIVLLGLICPLQSFSQSQNLPTGWTLLGNDAGVAINTMTAFGNANSPTAISANVATVWTWSNTPGRWNFFTPSMTAQELTSYATAKGYGVLSSIAKGEGYWVNVKSPFAYSPLAAISFPLNAVQTKVATNGVSLTGTAIDGADTWTLSMSSAPASDEIFEGVLSKKNIVTITLKLNGVVGYVESSPSYFSTNPFTFRGAILSDGSYSVDVVGSGTWPMVAKVGESGSLGTTLTYTNSAKTTIKEIMQSTWTLESDTPNTAFSCSNNIIKNISGTQLSAGSGCLKIDTSGNILGLKYIISVPGKTLVFK